MKRERTIVALLLILILLLSLGVGCQRENSQSPQPNPPTPNQNAGEKPSGNQNGEKNPSPGKGKEEQAIDQELTESLKGEEEVSDGRVYEQGDFMVGTLAIESGVPQSRIDELVEKYAQQIKKKYPDKKVNVQAVQNNENVADVTIE